MTEAWSRWEGHVVDGEFHLKKYLGDSERGAVFLTEERGPQSQPLAIKLIAAPPADANLQLSRWELAQGLSHPHLIRLIRSGRCRLDSSELIFAVMEYAEENLAQILLERALTPQEASDVLIPTLDTLAYLHSQGFVHGHVRPPNILAINDELKLASDNISRMHESPSDPGNPSLYDPPESLGSPAADVWSLGMTLTEVLTQHLPSWNDQDVGDPELPPNLPAPYLEIVRGCLRRDPNNRLTIAGISARLFSGFPQPATPPIVAKAAPPVAAKPSSPKPQQQALPAMSSQEPSPIRRLAFPAVIVTAAVAVALLAGSGLLHHQAQTQPDVVRTQPEQKTDVREPGASKPSPMTPSHTTNVQAGQQSGSSSNGLDPTPAALRPGAPAPGSVVHQVLPDVPQSASDTIQGTIRTGVRVKVDTAGNVAEADLDSPGPSKYFARLSLEAAQRWKFVPSDQSRGREFILHFEFKNSGAGAYATRAGD